MSAEMTGTMQATDAGLDPDGPPLLRTYALTYAFTLLWSALALAALASRPLYSFDGLYTALVALPPAAGVLSLLLTDRPRKPVRALMLSAALLTTLAVTGSVAIMFVGMLFIPLVAGLLLPYLGAFGALSVVLLVAVAVPLALALPAAVRERRAIHALALLAALAVVAGVLATTVLPGQVLVEALRKDQSSFLVGALTWYLPAFGVAAAVCRRVGLA